MLILPTGHFNQSAIAARTQSLWAARQEFLSHYSGPILEKMRGLMWDTIIDRVWAEASRTQAQWIIQNIKPQYSASERAEMDSLIALQKRVPIWDHDEFRRLSLSMTELSTTIWNRAIAAAGIAQDRESAMDGVNLMMMAA